MASGETVVMATLSKVILICMDLTQHVDNILPIYIYNTLQLHQPSQSGEEKEGEKKQEVRDCNHMVYHPHASYSYHNTSADDRILPFQWDLSIHNIQCHFASIIGNNVPQIPSMPVIICWSTMLLLMGIEMASSTHTPSRVVSKLVDVKAMLSWLQSSDLTGHPRLPTILEKNVVCTAA